MGPFVDDPELTAAARALAAARNRRAVAERTATAPGLNWRGRRRWEREAAASRAAEHQTTNRWTAVAEPCRRHLSDQIHQLDEALRSLPTRPERDRRTSLDPTLEQLIRAAVERTTGHIPRALESGRTVLHRQRPIDTPDVGIEL
jgi:hypothetical protein